MVDRVVVTGGGGFIGSALIRHLVADLGVYVVNVDALTYAGNPDSLAEVADRPGYCFEHVDVRDRGALERVFREHRPEAVVHLAAESHVDRSIDDPWAFVDTNTGGTGVLLEVARGYWRELSSRAREAFRFHHVSTDEVYGSLGKDGRFREDTAYAPSSPYSASKAGSDHLVRAWDRTYGLPSVITNCSNNYGPYQFPEKLIPLMILNGAEGRPMPVYGDGANVRDWLYVEDHVEALWEVLDRGAPGETYHIGGACERSNIEVVRSIARELDEQHPRPEGSHSDLIRFVPDRPGHDYRYAMDITKIHRELGWWPRESFESGLRKTVRWYLDNRRWIERVQAGGYRRERLGRAEAHR